MLDPDIFAKVFGLVIPGRTYVGYIHTNFMFPYHREVHYIPIRKGTTNPLGFRTPNKV